MSFDRNIQIGQLMTTNVITLNPNDTLLKVEEIFKTNDFHHIPVVDKENEVKGIISRSDFNKMQGSFTIFNTKESKRYNHSIFNSTLVEEVMSKKLAKLSPEDTAIVAVGFFRENIFHALPIVDADNKLMGMLTTYDLLTYAYKEPVYMG